jgi:hypothetical protein
MLLVSFHFLVYQFKSRTTSLCRAAQQLIMCCMCISFMIQKLLTFTKIPTNEHRSIRFSGLAFALFLAMIVFRNRRPQFQMKSNTLFHFAFISNVFTYSNRTYLLFYTVLVVPIDYLFLIKERQELPYLAVLFLLTRLTIITYVI